MLKLNFIVWCNIMLQEPLDITGKSQICYADLSPVIRVTNHYVIHVGPGNNNNNNLLNYRALPFAIKVLKIQAKTKYKT